MKTFFSAAERQALKTYRTLAGYKKKTWLRRPRRSHLIQENTISFNIENCYTNIHLITEKASK